MLAKAAGNEKKGPAELKLKDQQQKDRQGWQSFDRLSRRCWIEKGRQSFGFLGWRRPAKLSNMVKTFALENAGKLNPKAGNSVKLDKSGRKVSA
jgi:hypothetical protein